MRVAAERCSQGTPHRFSVWVLVVLDMINATAKLVAASLLAIATLSVAYQILIRFVLDHLGINLSAPWTEEIARYSLIWAVFVGSAVICRNAGLIAVDMLPHFLPPPLGRAVKYLSILVTMGFFSVLIWIGAGFAATGAIETSPVMRIPMSLVYLAVPVGSVLAVFNLVGLLFESLVLGRDINPSNLELDAD